MSNLSKYQMKQSEINIALIKKSIQHIKDFHGEISQSSVSRATFDLADSSKNEKGIVASTICKNKIYKAIVDNAMLTDNKINLPKNIMDFSAMDTKIMLSARNIQYANLERENQVLKHQLREYQKESIVSSGHTNNIKSSDTTNEQYYKTILRDVIHTLLSSEVVYIDKTNPIEECKLKIYTYETVLVGEKILREINILGEEE